MLKKLLLLFFVLSFSSPAFAAWRFNPHTGKPDYYEATGELLDGDKGEVVVSSGVWSLENAAVIGKLITGFSSGAGALAGTDTILQAINKLDGNIGTKQAAGSYEVTTNKENTTIDTSTTKYPTVNLLKTGLDAKAATAQTFYIGTTQVAINRSSAQLTLADIRLTPRIVTTTDDATAVIDVDVTDQYQLTAVANATEFSTTGTPTAGQRLLIRVKDAGVAKALTYNAVFRAVGITLPTTTTANKTTYIGCIYNATDSKFDCVATGTEA